MTDVVLQRIDSVLVANRGEIAVRVLRACRDMGIRTVACYADPDEDSVHVRMADSAVRLPGASAADTYLDAAAVLAAAAEGGVDAVHPGYGFLSEDADFAQAVVDAGLVWVGPPPAAMRALGDKISARRIAQQVGAPLAAGTDRPLVDADEAVAFAQTHGLPVAIKAAFGGGGRGLKVATTMEQIPDLLASAVREAQAAFGRGECFVERYLPQARHVEAQVLADQHGNFVVVGTRDCSLQRRHQKLVEEAPAPYLLEDQRRSVEESAIAICREAGYVGAGTVEYLVGSDGTVSFLEVNTRLQVEHPVTEETSGIDLVVAQLEIAAGQRLDLPAVVPARGHSIEFRLNGEDPQRDFMPAPGTVTRWHLPTGPGVRVDSGVEQGSVVGGQFDSLLAKVIVTGRDRAQALVRARRALDELQIGGITTVLPFHRQVLTEPDFVGADEAFRVHTRWIEEDYLPRHREQEAADDTIPASVGVRVGNRSLRIDMPGLGSLSPSAAEHVLPGVRAQGAASADALSGGALTAPMQGTVISVAVEEGQHVQAGEVLVVVEAMKMENAVRSPFDGVVQDVEVKSGDTVAQDAPLCRVVQDGAAGDVAPDGAAPES